MTDVIALVDFLTNSSKGSITSKGNILNSGSRKIKSSRGESGRSFGWIHMNELVVSKTLLSADFTRRNGMMSSVPGFFAINCSSSSSPCLERNRALSSQRASPNCQATAQARKEKGQCCSLQVSSHSFQLLPYMKQESVCLHDKC